MSKRGQHDVLPIIAIGASAGGLEACRALLKEMPGAFPAAFILIMHLDPSHDSMMADLLASHTRLKVAQATDHMTLEPGMVHVIPPGAFLVVKQRVIHLSDPDGGKGVRMPFDTLLRSLAKEALPMACVVLSGTGTDGSLGLIDVHTAGGLVIAQDPKEAGYSGMPGAAIATGLVAQILSTGRMVAALQEYVSNAPLPSAQATDEPRPPAASDVRAESPAIPRYDELLDYVAGHATQDISLYKRGTLERRIARRMALLALGAGDVMRYLDILRSDPEEITLLTSDLLIHVTSFFRDTQVFETLSAKAIPDILKTIAPDRPLRIWVAGCSTGEEAYSLAMICIEAMEAAGLASRLQILASDVDPEAIASARAGFYPKDIVENVSHERLVRFFVAEDGGYRVSSTLRDLIMFTVADLLSDPPFSKIDLVSCRNVLIYLGSDAQKRVIARCCFALRPGGLLLLGVAEMPGQSDACFGPYDKDARIWRRIGQSHPSDLHFAIGKREMAMPVDDSPGRRTALADLCRRIVLETYAPAAVLLNSRLECLYFLGPTERYLKVTQGHPDPSIVSMLPKALRVRFRTAAAACGPTNPRVVFSGGRLEGPKGFDIAVHSVSAGTEPLLLVCFINTPNPSARATYTTDPDRQDHEMEADLEAARSDLEQEVVTHSADAAEALSLNEEFQSTEELLASKEELQSLNEELTALNSQLQETLERHRTTANDLRSVLYSTDLATLFLDIDLNIRFFTPAARAIFRVIPTDVGRPLADLAAGARDDDLTADARQVLKTFDPIERETAGLDGHWFTRRVQSYRAEGGRVEGVVITYIDISERKRTNAALLSDMAEADRATKAKSRFLASTSHDLRQPLQSMALLQRLQNKSGRSAEGTRLANLMDQTLNSMTAMLDSILDVNRIDSGTVHPDMRPVAVGPLMQRLADEFAPQCNARNLKMRFVPCGAYVQTDPQLLEQILRNLLSNALKHTPTGSILMGCRRSGAVLKILVCDSGIGISAAERKSIFDPYQQGEKAVAFSGNGLGLGLSIVHRLVQLMDHAISVQSTPGRGSAFSVDMPIVSPGPEMAGSVPRNVDRPMVALQTGTILLVEDEEPLRQLLAEVLEKQGHTVISKFDAQHALHWAMSNETRPDLLLADLELRGSDNGLSLAEELHDLLGGTLPTIILTGDITTQTRREIISCGFKQLVKPVTPEVLLLVISDLMLTARGADTRVVRRSKSSQTTVHVIDDDPMIRETMRRLFQTEGWSVVTYPTAEDFLSGPRPNGVACLLVDHALPGMDGVTLISQLRAERSSVPAVILTGHGDAAMAVAALRAGAFDMIEKPSSAAELLASIRQAFKSSDNIRPQSEAQKAAQMRLERERQVLTRVLAGVPNKIIAADLGINQRTVEHHRASVMRKTEAASVPALVRLAFAGNFSSV